MILDSNINVVIEKFRSVKKAELKIDGITVLAGENGSGKSTISKLIYHIFKMASNFEKLVVDQLRSELSHINKFLEILIFEIGREDRKARHEFIGELGNLKNRLELTELDSNLRNDYVFFLNLINKHLLEKGLAAVSKNIRLKAIANDLLNITTSDNSSIPFKQIIDKTENIFNNVFKVYRSRNTLLVKEQLKYIFQGDLPKKVEIFEYEDQIFSLDNKSISIPYSIQNAIYFDTPMMFGERYSDLPHWEDTNSLLEGRGVQTPSNTISKIISSDILKGDVVYDEEYSMGYDFLYKRYDGKSFNLLECATGVKSFSILQLLLKNGSINDKSLVIIDEPESHLHPQWIVEYARLIVLINKYIGAKFLLASHNPDMISAIRYISEKEGNLQKTNFYLAKLVPEDSTYFYHFLDKDIEPIFESFNIALDRIEKYGI